MKGLGLGPLLEGYKGGRWGGWGGGAGARGGVRSGEKAKKKKKKSEDSVYTQGILLSRNPGGSGKKYELGSCFSSILETKTAQWEVAGRGVE